MDDLSPHADAPLDRPKPPAEYPAPSTAPPPEPPPGAPRRRRHLWRWLLLLVVLIGAGWLAWRYFRSSPTAPHASGGHTRGSGGTPPQAVGAATVGRGDVRIILNALGTVTPLANVTVKTQIAGQLVQLGFDEGQMVKAGDFLAQIDPRPYQVALEQAQANLARDTAALHGAQLDLQRYRTLVSQDSIARQTLDTEVATVGTDEGTVKADQAAIDSAKLNLVYCRITAPVGGRVGLRQVDAGNYVQTSDTNGIVVITQLQPISVIFTLPEDDIPQVQQRMFAGNTLPVAAWDRSDTIHLDEGTLHTVDNQVDTTTGTVKLRAEFPNAKLQLFPSQFVNARLLVNTLKNVVTAPAAAIQRGEPGTFVYVIGSDGKVHVQVIKLGPQDGQTVAVNSGLQVGERVVIDGADRLKDGMQVTVPPANATPAAGSAAGASAGSASDSSAVDSSSTGPASTSLGTSGPGTAFPSATVPGVAPPSLAAPSGGFAPANPPPSTTIPPEQPQQPSRGGQHRHRHYDGGKRSLPTGGTPDQSGDTH